MSWRLVLIWYAVWIHIHSNSRETKDHGQNGEKIGAPLVHVHFRALCFILLIRMLEELSVYSKRVVVGVMSKRTGLGMLYRWPVRGGIHALRLSPYRALISTHFLFPPSAITILATTPRHGCDDDHACS